MNQLYINVYVECMRCTCALKTRAHPQTDINSRGFVSGCAHIGLDDTDLLKANWHYDDNVEGWVCPAHGVNRGAAT